MRTAALVASVFVTFLPSCGGPVSDHATLTADLACETAARIVQSRKTFSPVPAKECCGKCVNGKVKSGDGLAWVPCPCPASCKCKVKP